MRTKFALGAALVMALTNHASAQQRYSFTSSTNNGQIRLTITLVSPEIVHVVAVPTGANTNFPRVQLVLPQPPTFKDHFQNQARGICGWHGELSSQPQK